MPTPNFCLVGDRIAVKLDPVETMSKGGIALPDNAKKKSTKGTVVAVGPGKWSERNNRRIPMMVSVGARVLIDEYGRTKTEIDGEEYHLIVEEDVLALLPQEAATKK